MKASKIRLIISCLVILGLSIMSADGSHWRDADRSSAGIAPLPDEHDGPVLQVYAARTFGWRGSLGVHTWFSIKSRNANNYTVHHVLGFRSRRGRSVVVSAVDVPDRHWYGNKPNLLVDIRGNKADALIPKVLAAIESYPYADKYVMWPGPNSNTFTAYVGRQVPELKLDLPSTAIGKDYLGDNLIDTTPGGSGYQISLFGLLGLSLAVDEGVELNILGLNFGINPLKLQMKLPGVGTIGKQSDFNTTPN
ncbi:MAG: hypothetical protein ACI9XC_002437 [Gammaproteobacteria bacterium]|jgi:hypothetical protein